MFDIDRSLMVVRPKQAFFDWVQSVNYEPNLTLARVRDDPSAYLIPELMEDSEEATILEWCYEGVFEAELEAWYTDTELWPRERNLKMFLEWFEVEFHSLVCDLLDTPIQVIDYGMDDADTVGSNGN
jgi:hypothetical protein